jgi:hypothetical protein
MTLIICHVAKNYAGDKGPHMNIDKKKSKSHMYIQHLQEMFIFISSDSGWTEQQ